MKSEVKFTTKKNQEKEYVGTLSSFFGKNAIEVDLFHNGDKEENGGKDPKGYFTNISIKVFGETGQAEIQLSEGFDHLFSIFSEMKEELTKLKLYTQIESKNPK